MDTVDALHAAEDSMMFLRATLESVAAHTEHLPTHVVDEVKGALTFTSGYCRCDLNDEGVCDNECCGCPGKHDFPHD